MGQDTGSGQKLRAQFAVSQGSVQRHTVRAPQPAPIDPPIHPGSTRALRLRLPGGMIGRWNLEAS